METVIIEMDVLEKILKKQIDELEKHNNKKVVFAFLFGIVLTVVISRIMP